MQAVISYRELSEEVAYNRAMRANQEVEATKSTMKTTTTTWVVRSELTIQTRGPNFIEIAPGVPLTKLREI
jgi:hypothetical protein